MTKLKYDLVYIEWQDAYSKEEFQRWHTLEDLEEPGFVTCASVGFLVKENKMALTLMPNLSDINRVEVFGEAFGGVTIIKSNIIYRECLISSKYESVEEE